MRRNSIAPVPEQRNTFITSRRIASSLLLQQLLYFNVFWSIGWLVAFSSRIFWKVCQRLSATLLARTDRCNTQILVLQYGKGLKFRDPDVVRTVLSSFWLAAEPIRLWSGYYGNLQENVPWLVIFLILTMAPQVPVCFYLMMVQRRLWAFDKALQVVMAAFLFSEICVALYAVVRMLRIQKKQFYLFEHALRAYSSPTPGAQHRPSRQ